jgi:hypothetical protein
MACQRQRQLFVRNAAAIVGDRDALHAAFFETQRDLGRARIERILQ